MARKAVVSQGQPMRMVGLGKQTLTVSTSVVSLTPPATGTVLRIKIRSEGQPTRMSTSAANPTSTTGIYILKDEETLENVDPDDIRAIRDSAATGDATWQIEYEGLNQATTAKQL